MTIAVHAAAPPRLVPPLFAYIAGFVDTCAYFALFGVFVAQLTGSFVMASSAVLSGRWGLLTVAAIPTFFVAGGVATALAVARAPAGSPLPWVLALECTLLTAMLGLILAAQPLANVDAPPVIAAALLGVAAMGVQSAMVRLFMKGAPSTNVMTSNTTQLAIDVTILLLAVFGCGDREQAGESRERFRGFWPTAAGFVVGTACGWFTYKSVGAVALAVPVAIAFGLLAWTLRREISLRAA